MGERGAVNTQLEGIAKSLIAQQVLQDKLVVAQDAGNSASHVLPVEQQHSRLLLSSSFVTTDNNEDDTDLHNIRERRKQQLRRERFLEQGGGRYDTVDQENFFKAVLSPRCVCHFYHREFKRCQILDRHLEALAKQHVETRFIKIDAEKSPFVVTKLAIRVLPTLVMFRDGIAVDRCTGFAEFGNNDGFTTRQLAGLLRQKQLIQWNHNEDADVTSSSEDDDT